MNINGLIENLLFIFLLLSLGGGFAFIYYTWRGEIPHRDYKGFTASPIALSCVFLMMVGTFSVIKASKTYPYDQKRAWKMLGFGFSMIFMMYVYMELMIRHYY